MNNRLYAFYKGLVLARPGLSLLLVFAFLLAMMAGIPNFKLDASADSLTLENDTSLNYFREINKRYQSGDFLVVTFTPRADLFADESLHLLSELQAQLAKVEGVTNVNSILTVPLLYSPRVTMSGLTEQRTLLSEGVDRAQAKQEFLTSPIYRDMLLGPNGKTTAILLNLAVDNHYIELVRERDDLRALRAKGRLSETQKVKLAAVSQDFLDYRTASAEDASARVVEVRQIVARFKDRAEMFVGGVTMITADMVDFIKSDLRNFGGAILLFIVVLLTVIFRHWLFVVLPLATALFAVLMMVGWLSWVDWRLTVVSSNFVALLLIIGLAVTIHLVVRYRELAQCNPAWDQQQLVESTVKLMFKPVLFTVMTTIVAFASLVVSNIRPVMDFGWMMVIGLVLVLILAFVLLPAGLLMFKRGYTATYTASKKSAAITGWFSCITERYGSKVLLGWLLVSLVSGYGITQLKVENRFIDYFRPSTEIYQGMTVIDQNLGGTASLDIILDAAVAEKDSAMTTADPFNEVDAFDSPDPFDAPEPVVEADPFAEADPFSERNPRANNVESYWFTGAGLNQIEKLHDYLESLPEIGKVQSLAMAYKVARDINGNELNDFELAVLRQALPDNVNGLLVDPYLSAENNQTRITLRVRETNPNLRRGELIQKIRNFAVSDETGLKSNQVHVSGVLLLYNNMLQSLFKSQIVTLGAVFLGIGVMMTLLFRSVLLAFIGILPNMLAASVVLGVMGLFNIALDMMTITIAAIVVGIGVDNTIHYIHRFSREIELDGDYIGAMHRAHGSIGQAMFYTSVIIILGFSILALSNFIPSVYFGLLTALAMFAAIISALTLLPQLILLIKPFAVKPADAISSPTS